MRALDDPSLTSDELIRLRCRVATDLTRNGQYAEAHEHLDRAAAALPSPRDEGLTAFVDETRARVLLAEGRFTEAARAAERAVNLLEKGGAQSQLADALTLLGVARARLGEDDKSIELLRRALCVAEEAGAYANAAQAALALIEEHGARPALSQAELYGLYRRADDYLKHTQDAEAITRLRACARVVMRRLSGLALHERGFTFYEAVQEFEARIIEGALEEACGSVTGAAKLLGLKHQTLISMIETRHTQLRARRKPPERRRRSIIKKGR